MAREQRKDVDYFPHECAHGRKMHIIEAKYGNDGYAAWFKLLEQLGKANNHYIDISEESNLMFLASIFRIEEEKTKYILIDLAKLGAIDKDLFEKSSIIFSHKFTQSVEDAYRKRKTKIFQYSDLLDEIKAKKGQSTGIKGQSGAGLPEDIPKEKKRRVEERKEEKSIDSRKLKFASTLEPFLEKYGKYFLNDFYKYWTEPNKSNSKFKQELERTWSLERRLEMWARNDKNFNNGKSNSNTSGANNGKVSGRSTLDSSADNYQEFA